MGRVKVVGLVIMHRLGHFGMSLLWVGVIITILPLEIALPLSVMMIAVEPLPDYDMKTEFVDHRGYSHTIIAAAIVASTLSIVVVGSQYALTQQAMTLNMPIITEFFTTTLPATSTTGVITFIGVFLGFVSHYSADMITVGEGYYGVQPFMPVSHWECGVQLCRADDSVWNTGLLIGGVMIAGVALYVKMTLVTGGVF